MRATAAERFWAKVDQNGPEGCYFATGKGRCWIWQGSKSVLGYGSISVEGKSMPVHRYSWELHSGKKIKKGLHVDHLCRRPSCVNPMHLEPVPPFVNSQRGKRSFFRPEEPPEPIREPHFHKSAVLSNLKVKLLCDDEPAYVIAAACGMHPSQLSRYALGQDNIKPLHLKALCRYFKCTQRELLGASEFDLEAEDEAL